MSAIVVVAVTAPLSAEELPATAAGGVAPMAGPGETGLMIQNLDRSKNVTVCGLIVSRTEFDPQLCFPSIAPGSFGHLWMPGTWYDDGTYAAYFEADGPIAGIARTDWPGSGASAIYSNPIPDTEIAVPLVVRDYYGQSSLLTIQNTEWATATVTVALFDASDSEPEVSKHFTIPWGGAITLDLGADDPDHELIDTPFLGSATISSATEIAVSSLVEIKDSAKAVYGFEGVPTSRAQQTLYVPLFRAEQRLKSGDPSSSRLDSGISVVNPGASEVEVAVTYYGAGGSCAGDVVTSPPVSIPSHGNHVFYQGDPASQGLMPDCYGSAMVRSSSGGILAIVNEARDLGQTSAAYTAFTSDQGATSVALPLYRREHAFGLTTGISVMNIGDRAANITLEFMEARVGRSVLLDCNAQCTQTVGPSQAAVFWPGAMSSIPPGTYGSAVIESTQPVVAIVNDVELSGAVDMSTYTGIGVDASAIFARQDTAFPLVLKRAERPW